MVRFKLSAKVIRLTALVITALGFGARLYNLGVESLWYDELLQVNLALADISSMLRRLPYHAAVPLDYLISYCWIMLGHSESWVRFPAAVAGTLTLPVAFQLGRRMLGKGPGLLFMALLTCAPFHIRYSQEVRPYALGLLGVMLFSYFIWRLRATGNWRYLGPLQAAALIFSLSHYFATTVFAPWLLFFGIDTIFNKNRSNSPKALAGVLITGFVCLLVLAMMGWGPTLFKVSESFGETLVNPEQFTAAPEEKPNLGAGPEVSQEFISRQILGPLGAGVGGVSLWLFGLLVIFGLLNLAAQKNYKLGLLLFLWIVTPVVGIVAFLVHRGTFFAPRYIIFVLPAYFLASTMGILFLPQLLKKNGSTWLAALLFFIVAGSVFADLGADVYRLYYNKDKEDWRLVGDFIASNAGPNDAVIAVKAEPAMNWYYPPATTDGNRYSKLEIIQETVAQAERSWVILSIYSSGIDANIKAWLSDGEQGAVRLTMEPVITVYYLGHNVDKDQLLKEIQSFALPVNHELYASLARENRRQPEVARRYYQLAIEHAPNEEIRTQYEAAMKR
jgi:4-amino-4-deoxy-L-arabinose transferase-like glycosyltransferase